LYLVSNLYDNTIKIKLLDVENLKMEKIVLMWKNPEQCSKELQVFKIQEFKQSEKEMLIGM